jgi:hypothetical protein
LTKNRCELPDGVSRTLTLDPQLYAFALRQGSPLRKSINRELLHEISEPDWADVLYRFMGYAPN